MNLRTITFWALYDPKSKNIVATRQFKYEIERDLHQPEGTVVVKLKGHYVRRMERTAKP